MTAPILVTGATGKVGGQIIKNLTSAGIPVKAAVRNPTSAGHLRQPGIELVACDYQQPETFANAFANVEHAFLLLLSLAAPPENVIAIVDSAIRAGVRHLVTMSGMSAGYDTTLPAYTVEQHIQQSGIGYTLLRPNWFMQNFSTFMRDSIINNGTIAVPAAHARASFIDMRDIAAVATTALTQPGHAHNAYTLTGSAALSHDDVAAILSQVSGRTITYTPITDEEMRDALKNTGSSDQGIDVMSKLYQSFRAGDAAPIFPDVEQVLGRAPIPFEQYATDHADAWT